MHMNPTQNRSSQLDAETAAQLAGAESMESTIREIALDFGVSLRALRFYEDRGLLRPRREGAARFYGARERRDLRSILKGKRLGFTLSEIHDMLRSRGGPLASYAPESAANRSEVEETEIELALPPEQIVAQIGYLERQRKDLDAAIVALRDVHRRMTETSGLVAVG